MCQKICFQYLKYFHIYFICGEEFNKGIYIYIYKRVLKPDYHFLYYISCDKRPARLICNDLGSSVVILLNDKNKLNIKKKQLCYVDCFDFFHLYDDRNQKNTIHL